VAPVTTAVVPVAGLGTRLRPATRALPKEMLPVGGKPVVQHVVEELAANGIAHVVFVTANGKEAIEDHFVGSQAGVKFASTIQPAPRGLGDAVLQADGFTGDGPFAVALGDAILGTREHPLVVARLAAALEQYGAVCAIAVRDVPRAQTGRYGIVDTDNDGDEIARVTRIVEKPHPDSAPSTLAVSARYVMTPAIFAALRETPTGHTGELELTDAIARLVDEGAPVVALRLGAIARHDVGTHESYARAFISFALTDPEHGASLRQHARELLDGDG
jgi:UTP--glucose-1-phosphate uridylyltransferase